MQIQELFYDADLAKEFSQKGFVVVKLLSKADLHALEAVYSQVKSDSVSSNGFYASIWSTDKSYRKKVNDDINNILFPLVQEKLRGIAPVLGNFHVKQPGAGELGAHQDWSFVDEPENDSCLVWCPLHSVDEDNGCLHVIPFSHQLKNYTRGRFFDVPFLNLLQTTIPQLLQPVPLQAGEAIVMHSRLVHASPVNKSNKPRIAASVVIKPENSLLFHWILVKNGIDSVQKKVSVTADFFNRYNCFETLEELPAIDTIPNELRQLSEKELMATCSYSQRGANKGSAAISVIRGWLNRYFQKPLTEI